MDSYSPNTTTTKHKRLTKQPPPGSAANSSMNQNTTASLQRHPSSSQSPASSQDSHDHRRTPSYHTSSSSSLERSPHSANAQQSESYNNRYPYASRQSLDEKTPDEFNAHPGTLSTLDSTKATGYQNSLRRPGPPPLSYTTPNAKLMSPSLRQSASFSMGERSINATPPDGDAVSVSSSKRYSDEAGKNTTSWKKKSGISSFFGNVLGSPRSTTVKISAPENPVHVTHVGYDNETGQFTVCLRQMLAVHYFEVPTI